MEDICECGGKSKDEYIFVKCRNCGEVVYNFFKDKKWKLKIHYDDNKDEILIVGDKAGSEFLASRCLAIIERTGPSGHIHLEWQMNNLIEGSTKTNIGIL